MKPTLFILFFALVGDLASQDLSSNAGIRAMSSANLSEYFQGPKHYRFKQFQPGRILYKNGNVSGESTYNYDFVTGNILKINQQGDTTEVEDNNIHYFKIANQIFLRSSGNIVEVNSGKEKVKLGVSVKYLIKRIDQISNNGYGSSYDPTGGSSTPSSSRGMRKVYMDNSFTYYICMDNNLVIFKATRKKIIKAFSKKIPDIEEYLDKNNINVKSGQELEFLIEYLNSALEGHQNKTTLPKQK